MLNSVATVFLIIWAAQSHQQVTMDSWSNCVKAANALAPHFDRAVCVASDGATHVGGRRTAG